MIEVPAWLEVALAEALAGVRERPGPVHSERILEYHGATTLQATSDEVPWCSSFACHCVESSGYASTRSARARSWLLWGHEISPPAYGSIVVLKRGPEPQPGRHTVDAPGHVGFLMSRPTPDEILLLGGNQSDQVCVRVFPAAAVLAYRWADESARRG